MEKNLIAAITGAVSTYIQQEEVTKAFAALTPPHAQMSPWRLFGHQELMRTRTNWRTKRPSR